MIGLDDFIGFALIAVLLKMNHTLGKLCSKMDMVVTRTDDHENRLRTLEHTP